MGSLSRHWRVAGFDWRGTGLSQRDVGSVSFDTMMTDLVTVIAALESSPVALDGVTLGGLAALAYATEHPANISHLILTDTFARTRDFYALPQSRALRELVASDWDSFTEATATTTWGERREEARQRAKSLRDLVEQKTALSYFAALENVDLSEGLVSTRTRALIIQHAGVGQRAIALAQNLAASLPDAQLALIPGVQAEGMDELAAAIKGFLGVEEDQRLAHESNIRTVLFTDIVGHTEMMQRLGDARGRALLREHERITRETLRTHGGREVKTLGDGFMASFGSVTSAVECAVALQRAFTRSETMPERLTVRVGLNAGEPIEEDGDLFGSTVILASRIAAKAGAGEILVPDTVRGLLSGKGFVFGERGEFIPKGFSQAVRLYDVRWRD